MMGDLGMGLWKKTKLTVSSENKTDLKRVEHMITTLNTQLETFHGQVNTFVNTINGVVNNGAWTIGNADNIKEACKELSTKMDTYLRKFSTSTNRALELSYKTAKAKMEKTLATRFTD